MLRYPAMMVPSMQGDDIDSILSDVSGGHSRIVDPFVGSGTVMTEALLRGLDFTGVDINPLGDPPAARTRRCAFARLMAQPAAA